jgi:hypothetical protein
MVCTRGGGIRGGRTASLPLRVDGVDQLELTADGTGGEGDGVRVGEEAVSNKVS